MFNIPVTPYNVKKALKAMKNRNKKLEQFKNK